MANIREGEFEYNINTAGSVDEVYATLDAEFIAPEVVRGMSVADIMQYFGMKKQQAKYFLLGFKAGFMLKDKGTMINKVLSSEQAYQNVKHLGSLDVEEFWILLLNRRNQVTSRIKISQGGVSGTVVDPKVLFRKALALGASSVILCHNHPSGNLQPSNADFSITKKLVAAGKVLDIAVLDHLIVSRAGYYSMADQGEM